MSETTLWPMRETESKDLFELIDANRQTLKKFWWEKTMLSVQNASDYVLATGDSELAGTATSVTRGIYNPNNLIGIAGIHSINWGEGTGALGYWIGEEHQHKGHATKAVRELSRIAFEELDLRTLTITPRADNTGSRAVAERAGFAFADYDQISEWHVGGDELAAPVKVARHILTRQMYERSVEAA